ncbi:unnamed protein product [Prunus armeniaca]
MKEEVDKLSTIRFIKDVDYPTWLANVVMVHKPRKGWRMCVDYTNLNRACPKDSFPLPRIDQLVDATAGHTLLSFIDAHSGYNQIFMHPEDQGHTSFITDRGLYCYKVMSFGLKNARVTYQRLVNSIFTPLIGNTMEVYVGDWVMRKVSLATKNPTEGTLGPTWEGPYEVTKVCRPGAYHLRDPKGKTLPHL